MISNPTPLCSADAALFENILHCEVTAPAAFVPGAGPGRLEHAQSLLRSLALIEDQRPADNQSERDENHASGQRLEAKLDLSLLLLGHLLEHTGTPLRSCRVCWSIRGARLEHSGHGEYSPGDAGILKIQPCDWLPEALELPASVLAVETGHALWLRFPTFAPALADALEQHLFRQHRRQVAQARTGA